jgi:hypothetical protein
MKAGRAKKPTAMEGGHMPNYSEDEDYFIAVAYPNVTVDPIRGVGQKGVNFWTRAHEKMHVATKSRLNLANTFRYKPRIQSNRGGRRGLPKVCS